MSQYDIPTIIGTKVSQKNVHQTHIPPTNEPKQFVSVGIETGRAIQQARLQKKLKQTDLAKQLNIPVDIIRNYENGTGQRNGDLLNRMGKLLGVKLTGKTIV
jgi:putative transcription factor